MRHALPVLLLVLGLAVWLSVDRDRIGRLFDAPSPPTRAADGAELVYELRGDPRPNYGRGPGRAAPHFAELIAAVGAEPDPALDQAALELAIIFGRHARLAPSGLLAFLLDAAGAPYWGVRQAAVVTMGDGLQPVAETLATQVDDRPGWVVGLGEVVIDGRHVRAILAARRLVDLEPVPREAFVGEQIRVAGTVIDGYRDPVAIAARPDGTIIDLDVETDGRHFTVEFEATEGDWDVELMADGPTGPAPLAQLRVHVETGLPELYRGAWPAESRPADPAAVFDTRITHDRAAVALPPLKRDPVLDRVAASHSADMRSRQSVGHRSPTTGDVGDRLRAAGYRATVSGENVALNRSLEDAHAGLMRSLGHRRNIISPDFDRIGLAAVEGEAGWYVTQVFARAAPELRDPGAAIDALLDRIDAARSRMDAPRLRLDARLERVADEEARRDSPSARRAAEAAGAAGVTGRIAGWTAALLDPARLELPESLLDASLRRVGVAIHRDPARGMPDVHVVLLAAD